MFQRRLVGPEIEKFAKRDTTLSMASVFEVNLGKNYQEYSWMTNRSTQGRLRESCFPEKCYHSRSKNLQIQRQGRALSVA